MRRWVPVLLIMMVTGSYAGPRETASAEVETAARAFGEAWAQNDIAALDRMLAAEYTHTDVNGQVLNRQQWLKYMRERKERKTLNHIAFRDLKVRMLTEHAAVVTGENTIRGSLADEGIRQSQEFVIRFTQVWVKENGTWKRATFEGTPILPTAAGSSK